MKSSKELVNKLVKETLEQKYTNAPSSWNDLIEELSKEIKHTAPSDLFVNSALIKQQLLDFRRVSMQHTHSEISSKDVFNFQTKPQPFFN